LSFIVEIVLVFNVSESGQEQEVPPLQYV